MVGTKLRGLALLFVAAGLVASCSSSGSGVVAEGDGGSSSPDARKPDGSGTHPDSTTMKGEAGSHGDGAVDAGCGAKSGSLCGDGGVCASGVDCKSGVCMAGVCVPAAPTCTDGVKNGMETDVDCGGSMCPACGTGMDCLQATDCQSLVCVGGKCQAPSPTDGVKNDSETDVDCGGATLANGQPNPASDMAPACDAGKTCAIASDCVSSVCASGPVLVDNLDGGPGDAAASGDAAPGDGGGGALICQSATDHDGVENDSETDVDCGGGENADGSANTMSDGAPACGDGKKCALATDCASGVCAMGVCESPSASDGVQNDSETDVDCGGGTLANGMANPASDGAPACADGDKCILGTDCVDLVCATAPLTQPSTTGDPVNCPAGDMCTCQKPTPKDGIKNDSETDVDCGGGASLASDGAPDCADGKKCLADTDCLAGFCSLVSNTCVDGQSCKGLVTPAAIMDVTTFGTGSGTAAGTDAVGTPDTNGTGQHAGLDTCGTGESTDPIADQDHESCCKSLPVTISGTALRYDKYEVTSGRMRQFLESLSTPYDVRDWANEQIAMGTTAGKTLQKELAIAQTGVTFDMLDFLPNTTETWMPLNAVIQTGALVMNTSGSEGCFTYSEAYGAATYWWPAETLWDQASSPARPFTQDYYDIKPVNCVPYWLGAAFCAWDGGRLPLQTEHEFVWDGGAGKTNTYPWGDAFIPNPYPTGTVGYPGNTDLQEAAYQPAVAHTVDWYNSNLGSATQPIGGFYYYPSDPLGSPLAAPPSIGTGVDYSPLISAPGRFFLDRTSLLSGTEAWQDLGADMIEMSEITTYVTAGTSFCDASGVLGTGESYNCQCPTDGCNDTACSAAGVHCGVTRGTGYPNYTIMGGSWEGHAVKETLSAAYPTVRQYGKLGIRCMRPAEP